MRPVENKTLHAIYKGINTAKKLQEHFNVSKQAISEYINNLKNAGLIIEEIDQEDKRRKIYKPHPEAIGNLRIDELLTEINDELKLTEEERSSLRQVILKAYKPILDEIYIRDPEKDLLEALDNLITSTIVMDELIERSGIEKERALNMLIGFITPDEEDEEPKVMANLPRAVGRLPKTFREKWKETDEYQLNPLQFAMEMVVKLSQKAADILKHELEKI